MLADDIPKLDWVSLRLFMFGCRALMGSSFSINALNYYSPTIFASIGISGTSVGLLATGVYGIVKMVVTLIFMAFLVDRLGRRPALLVGAVGSCAAMYYLAGYSKISGSFDHTPPRDSGANAAVAMVYIYAVFYAFSWNGIPWLFTAEVLPTRVRTLGMAVAVCVQWLFQFVVVYSVPHMIQNISYGTFLFYGSCTVVAFFFALFFIPETKGILMEDMELLFGPNVSVFAKAAQKNYELMHSARLEQEYEDEKGVQRVQTDEVKV